MKVEFVIDSREHAPCPMGWKSRDPHDYTGGCYCVREKGHEGRCKCDCGATHTRPPDDACDNCCASDCAHLWPHGKKCCPDCTHMDSAVHGTEDES